MAERSLDIVRHRGPVVGLIVRDRTTGEGVATVTDADDIDRIIRDARERAGSDPHDDKLPPDWAIIEAVLKS